MTKMPQAGNRINNWQVSESIKLIFLSLFYEGQILTIKLIGFFISFIV